jgi:hypothetical protein
LKQSTAAPIDARIGPRSYKLGLSKWVTDETQIWSDIFSGLGK